MTASPVIGAAVTARYDDGRRITFSPDVNHEIGVYVDGHEPLFLDALDLLRAVSHVALDMTWGPSPTEGGEQR